MSSKFLDLFDMEIQNRAFALRAGTEMATKATDEGDVVFYGAWRSFEEFLQAHYAPYAQKHGLSQEARTMAKLQAGISQLAAGVLPDSKVLGVMLDGTIDHVAKLEELEAEAPEEDAEFFAFVVAHERLQVDALRLRIDGKHQEAADALAAFMEQHPLPS